MEQVKNGNHTVSYRARQRIYEDLSGLKIRKVADTYTNPSCDYAYYIIPEEEKLISQKLIYLSDVEHCSMIFSKIRIASIYSTAHL
jgi:molybdopterin biosynthesis enzyme MoaB